MKLTQSQRADLLAQFLISKSMAALSLRDKLCDAKEMLEAYEDELASWPDPTPAEYGPSVHKMSDGFRSDVPVPLTEKQVKVLVNLPNSAGHIRNPENIDFGKYPIPEGYTVAGYEDCEKAKSDAGWAFFDHEWIINSQHDGSPIRQNWTYLRPLRDNER